jgi:hypothetical protein
MSYSSFSISSIANRPLPLPSFVFLTSTFPMCNFVLFCFCNPIRHCNHHHNPSCHPILLCNLYWSLDLLTKLMLLLHFSVCDSTPFLWH